MLGIALYDPRVSLTGDDSVYILSANDFIRHFQFPSFQGPLYPMVLSPLALIFGISLLPLKAFSLFCLQAFVGFTYLAFRRRIPATLLFSVLLLTAVNSSVLYYASQTYTEMFYMWVQSICLLYFFRYFIDKEGVDASLKFDIRRHLGLALVVLSLALSRSVGFSIIASVVVYFLLNKQWKNVGFFLLSFGLLFGIYQVLKAGLWGSGDLQFSSQGSSLLLKNFYRPELGHEDFGGFVDRLLANSGHYLSRDLLVIAGLRKMSFEIMEIIPFVAILVYLISCVGLYFSFKRNRYIFFTGLVAGSFLLVTFISLQTMWMQSRLIIPVFPLLLLIILAALYYTLLKSKSSLVQSLFFLPVLIMFFSTWSVSMPAIRDARKLKNEYSGLNPDWQNYMKASKWAGDNLLDSDLVACRKSAISTIYSGGKDFYAIYTVPSYSVPHFMEDWDEDKAKFLAVDVSMGFSNELFVRSFQHSKAELNVGNNAYIILNTDPHLQESLGEVQATILDYSEISGLLASSDNQALFYPDSLLANFKNAGVTHVLTANIRANQEEKNGQTVSTVERYLHNIELKYPSLFEVIHQSGRDDDEPAQILRIRWEDVD